MWFICQANRIDSFNKFTKFWLFSESTSIEINSGNENIFFNRLSMHQRDTDNKEDKMSRNTSTNVSSYKRFSSSIQYYHKDFVDKFLLNFDIRLVILRMLLFCRRLIMMLSIKCSLLFPTSWQWVVKKLLVNFKLILN